MNIITKSLDTVNTIALAFVALPGIVEQSREFQKEWFDRDDFLKKAKDTIEKVREANRRIEELEIENRKLLEANHGLAAERDGLQSELATLRAKPEAPSVGEGFEFCAKADATHASFCRECDSGYRWEDWQELRMFDFAYSSILYRFRRPIAKERPLVACTAEEASLAVKSARTQWMYQDKTGWNECSSDDTDWDTNDAYRTTAALSEWVTVPTDVFETLCALARCTNCGLHLRDEGHGRQVRRTTVPCGTVLG